MHAFRHVANILYPQFPVLLQSAPFWRRVYWLLQLDSPNEHLRVCFLGFSKAFDRIVYNILVQKLINFNVRLCLIPWIINFLSDRKQRVKLNQTFSEWLPVKAGVPQGSKLGPILFLIMVNDLGRAMSPNFGAWKYVDDVSLSENLSKGSLSSSQSTLDYINSWASDNWMRLNAKKCKELRLCFFKEKPQLSPLTTDDQPLEVVTSHKVLGLIIQNDLKWNEHIASVVAKASKRLHILRVLRRGGVPAADLVSIYVSLIRSILEYSCVVWHYALPSYLSKQLEKVQKRAFGIIFPKQTYSRACELAECPRLDVRRNDLCIRTLKKIDGKGPLSKHLTMTRVSAHGRTMRNNTHRTLYKCTTERLKRRFFPGAIISFNNNI